MSKQHNRGRPSNASTSNLKAVIHWVDEKKVSIDDVSIINNESDRHANARTVIKFPNGKSYRAIVRLISENQKELQDCEDAVAGEIDLEIDAQKEIQLTDKRGRAKRHKKLKDSTAASSRILSSALGEKPQPTQEQAQMLKSKLLTKKANQKAVEQARREIYEEVLVSKNSPLPPPVKRALDFLEEENPQMDNQNESEEVDSEDENDQLFDIDNADDEPAAQQALSLHKDNSSNKMLQGAAEKEVSDDDNERYSTVATSKVTNKCCSHCIALSHHLSKEAVGDFIACLFRHSDPEGTRKESAPRFLEVLEIPPNVPKCELTKGSGVYISVSDKNTIKSNGGGDPAKMARMALVALYGRETLGVEHFTVKGTRTGSKGLRPNVLSSLLAFVNRNKALQYSALDAGSFNRTLNRKKSQVQRLQQSSSSIKSSPSTSSSSRIKNTSSSSATKRLSSSAQENNSQGESSTKKAKQTRGDECKEECAAKPKSPAFDEKQTESPSKVSTPITLQPTPIKKGPVQGRSGPISTPASTSPWKIKSTTPDVGSQYPHYRPPTIVPFPSQQQQSGMACGPNNYNNNFYHQQQGNPPNYFHDPYYGNYPQYFNPQQQYFAGPPPIPQSTPVSPILQDDEHSGYSLTSM